MLDRFSSPTDARHCTYAIRSPVGDHAACSHLRFAGVKGRQLEPSASISEICEQDGLLHGPSVTHSKAI